MPQELRPYATVVAELAATRASRLKFLSNAVQFLEGQGIAVTDDLLKRAVMNMDDNSIRDALMNPKAGAIFI